MAAKLPNTVNTSNTAVTRWKKRRDLETTMNTLKKLLEPSIASKKGRKKNKPRSLAKKKLPTRTINRFENLDNDGEYYPNKLKRKARMEKIVLKPKHVLKVVVATNKRKRGTPHKGLAYEDSISSPTLDLKVHTPPRSLTPDIIKYELISPPHKSLMEMTGDDLMRMDEDSLSDEDLMEILTCPSPVWWEDPSDEFKGTVYLIKTAQAIAEAQDIKHTRNIANNSSTIDTNLKRTGTVDEIKGKAKKIAKLERILGNIKNRVLLNDQYMSINEEKVNNDNKKHCETDDSLVISDKVLDDIKLSADESDISKPRSLSSSCSDISVNEDDLLRNLESIDIPIGKSNPYVDVHNNTNAIEIKHKLSDDFEITDSSNNIPNDAYLKCDETEHTKRADKDTDLKQNIWNKTSSNNKQKTASETAKLQEHDKKTFNKKKLRDLNEKNADKSSESTDKSILKKLETQSEYILDVRLIQTPTNISNEVKIWSKLDNFKKHNFKPEDFDSDIIDVEDEIEIISKSDPLELKNETILIDDDSSNDATGVNTKLTEKNVIDDVIDNGDVNLNTSESKIDISKDAEALINDKNIINVDTIKIGNIISVRLIDTADKVQNELLKINPKEKKPIVKNFTPLVKPLKDYTRNIHLKMAGISERKVLPKDALETKQLTYPTCLKESNPKTYTKKTHSKHTEESNNDKHQNENIRNKNTKNRTIDTKNNADQQIVHINDLKVLLINPEPIKEDFDCSNKVGKKTEHLLKNNDLSITLINNSEVTGVAPLKLPTLTKKPKSLESPKAVISLISEHSEGTISDTNIQSLDEYENNNHIEEEYLDEESESLSDGEEMENTTKENQIAEIKLIYLKQYNANESGKGFSDKEPDIEEEYLDDDVNSQSTDEEMCSKTIIDKNDIKLNDFDQDAENKTIIEGLDDVTSIEEEYLDENKTIIEGLDEISSIEEEYLDEDKEYLEYSRSIDEANDKNIDITKMDDIELISDEDDRTSVDDTEEASIDDLDEDFDQNTKQNDEDENEKGCEKNVNDLVTVYQIVSKP